jgi:hypothetical protein
MKREAEEDWKQTSRRFGLCPLKTRCDHSPHYEDYDRANNCPNETSALASLIPPDRLAEVCCYKSSNNPEQGSQNKPLRLVLVARMKESRDHARHEPNYNSPKNTHSRLPVSTRFSVWPNRALFNDFHETAWYPGRGGLGALIPMSRRFPPPWSVEEYNDACFIVRDHDGQQLAYVYFEDEPGRRSAQPPRASLEICAA